MSKNNNFNSIIKKILPRKKYKDLLFRRVFSKKEDLLSLYNALNGSNNSNIDDLQITTLEDALYMSMKNDISFIVSFSLNLYEHQSSVNPNMPIRGFMYFAKLYEAYIKLNKLNIYGKKQIELPSPQYIIFYNGTEAQPDEQFLHLSDAFKTSADAPALECTAKVLNINYGHNKELLDKCKQLHDYSYFINQVALNKGHGMSIADAIKTAMDRCIDEDILKDILLKHKAEVFDMLLFTYDEKLYKKQLREEERAEGRAEGMAEGRAEGRAIGLAEGRAEGMAEGKAIGLVEGESISDIKHIMVKIQKGKSLDTIASELDVAPESIEAYYTLILNNPSLSAEEIYSKSNK